jgi:asparagine synthase (glutamine-hydrolysing)
MCGIIAVVSDVWSIGTDHRTGEDLPDIREHTARITHRGPDGLHIDEIHDQFRLGHTRLAIVDPSHAGDQPFQIVKQDQRQKLHWAANGEIYNHETIYEKLVQEGWDPSTRLSQSDCEVIGHAFDKYGIDCVKLLDGMFAFVITQEQDNRITSVMAARDPVGIKPLYYGKKTNSHYVFASELKALVGLVEPDTVVAIPPGHYWTPETGLVCYHNPKWLRDPTYTPWKEKDYTEKITDEKIRSAFEAAVKKRMMADVEYGFFLSGGIDSCVVAHTLLPLYRQAREERGDFRPIKTYTVGMEDSPDVMAAKAMVEALGGSKFIEHHVRTFTPDEVFDLIPKIVYHMETYEAELIRSAIPNWLLAERAARDVKMVLTGEGADELFAGYLYFSDAETPDQVQNELRRIYNMLGNVNLHRTDRMTMAHGLEARVPFLDTHFTELVMGIDPKQKMVDKRAVKNNTRGREKTFLRELFAGPNANGHSIPKPVLWRAKAMQCEGVGEDWVKILQNKIESIISDEEFAAASERFSLNTPHTKEECYYRKIFDEHYHGMEHVVKLWPGGGRALGAAWKSSMYTRSGLANVDLLSHSLQKKTSTQSRFAKFTEEICGTAASSGYNRLEALLTSGGDDRCMIDPRTATNKYHIRPRPLNESDIFRGSCTGNPPTARGYAAAERLYIELKGLQGAKLHAKLQDVFENHRRRISELLRLPDGAQLILCPSGSDAEYIPLAIARTLRPDTKIFNSVTQLREIGAGSAPASLGRFFSIYAPLVGKIAADRKHLEGFDGIEGVAISARERDGTVVLVSQQISELTEKALQQDHYPIVHGVFGGKTGLRDDVMPPSLDGGKKSLGIVDACQGRFTENELHEWLKQDSLVLFTGSKFWQAPPFCGAVIIPPSIADKLQTTKLIHNKEMLSSHGLGAFLTDKELPSCLDCWKPFLKNEDINNVGLALRWEAGLAGMDALAHISDEKRSQAVAEWAAAVFDMVQSEVGLEAWCLERSIVSIRVAKDPGSWLKMSELRDLFRWMSMDVSSAVSSKATDDEKIALSKITYIGQPVDVSETHAVVRIALGSEALLSFINDKKKTLAEDRFTVKKLAAIARYFDLIRESGL